MASGAMRAGSNPAGGTYPPLPSTRAFFGKMGEVSSLISPNNDAAPAGHYVPVGNQPPPVGTQAEDDQHPP